MYLNCINRIDEEDEEKIFESNVLFALYQYLKAYDFVEKDYKKTYEKFEYGKLYEKILEECRKEELSIDTYIQIIKKILNISE